ncbi:hypothetical protein EYB26_001944 [Talaromyces marneffei]|uniref:uncharacterized protein n=1 Tax=Talaromyces marneffei TaxID=37727 RepID=UPI0012A7F725|nr:uncharacterized protein EYB26_001944 [Talaromyces marneffei]QGA14291.1 hypothetical protein EYB26_001944 [Talaromyces marneffei]
MADDHPMTPVDIEGLTAGGNQPSVADLVHVIQQLQNTITSQQSDLQDQRQNYDMLIEQLNREMKKVNERNDMLAQHQSSAEEIKSAVVDAVKTIVTQPGGIHVQRTESKAEKVPNPDKFSGDRLKVDTFIAQLKNKFTADADKFPTERHMLSYAYALLDGDAAIRMTPFMNTDNASHFTTMEEFYKLLERSFGITNKHEYALEKLKQLKQKNQEFVVYLSEFENLLTSLTAQAGLPATYHELVTLLSKLDFNIRLMKSLNNDGGNRPSSGGNGGSQRNSGSNSNSGSNAQSGTRPGHSHHGGTQPAGDPMDLDAVKQAERQRRRDLNLCFYYADPNHKTNACPELAKKNAIELKTATETAPKTDESKN